MSLIACLASFLFCKGDEEMKIVVPNDQCKNCPWINHDRLCMFRRCVKHFGWISDKKVTK